MLVKIHPLEADYGMGYTFYYLSRLDKNWKESPKKREYVDLFLATTIGYGNMGWLVTDWGLDDPFGVETMARSYYLLQQLQQQYAFIPPQSIEYADPEGQMMSVSRAHATGAIADSRLHVRYANGTRVYVNRDRRRGPEEKIDDIPFVSLEPVQLRRWDRSQVQAVDLAGSQKLSPKNGVFPDRSTNQLARDSPVKK